MKRLQIRGRGNVGVWKRKPEPNGGKGERTRWSCDKFCPTACISWSLGM